MPLPHALADDEYLALIQPRGDTHTETTRQGVAWNPSRGESQNPYQSQKAGTAFQSAQTSAHMEERKESEEEERGIDASHPFTMRIITRPDPDCLSGKSFGLRITVFLSAESEKEIQDWMQVCVREVRGVGVV